MARIIPGSTIKLYGEVEASADNSESLVFRTAANREAYFANKLVTQVQNVTMVKKTGQVKIEVPGTTLAQCNYFSFINPAFDNRVYYCKIIDYDYVTNETAVVDWQIDWWLTDMFKVTFRDTYIEREHLSQAKATLASSNPYDVSLWEFRTPEPLDISRDLEKLYYTIGAYSDNTVDGVKYGKAVTDALGLDASMGCYLQLAEIDFERLDSEAGTGTKPSQLFVNVLCYIATYAQPRSGQQGNPGDSLGYIRLTQEQLKYLAGEYPTLFTNQGVLAPLSANGFWTGTFWSINSTALVPGQNALNPEYCSLYFPSIRGLGTSPYESYNLSYLMTALTRWQATDQIIGIYGIPNQLFIFAGVASQQSAIHVGLSSAKTKLSVTNKKLMHYPFSYLRLIAPNGDTKELHYEDFKNIQDASEDLCKVCCIMDIAEKPTMLLAPANYRMTGLETYGNANIQEALIYNQFPTMPYTIDAWLAQIASVSNSIIANSTQSYDYSLEMKQLDQYKQAAGLAAGGVNAVASFASGDIAGGVNQVVNTAFGAQSYEINKKALELEQGMRSQAPQTLAGSDATNVNYNLRHTKPTFACNKYFSSNGDGITNFNPLATYDIIYMRVSLNEAILEQYDRWFSNFGYQSGRCGVPYVMNYARNSSTPANLPSWNTIEGKECTFVKTNNANIDDVTAPSGNYIKAIFDRGVRLIKGDAT